MVQTTSKHLRSATELILIADIKRGLVPIAEPTAYASRLRTLLEALFFGRKRGIEQGDGPPLALEMLQTIHFVHWAIFDDDRRLLLVVDFDTPWEPYLRNIVDTSGPLLDAIFCHCEGYTKNSSFDGYLAFSTWVREHQIPCNFFYAGAPDLTSDDLRYLTAVEQSYAEWDGVSNSLDARVAKLVVPDVVPLPPQNRALASLFIEQLYRLRQAYPADATTPHSDQRFFDGMARLLTLGYAEPAFANGEPAPSPELQPDTQAWFQHISRSKVTEAVPVPDPEVDLTEVQGNILSSYSDMTHGALLLVRFESARQGGVFLQTLVGAGISTERARDAEPSSVACVSQKRNLMLTVRGLATLGLNPRDLQSFPAEFREGMQARAGLLGDILHNHPGNWKAPARNFPDSEMSTQERIDLSTVDAVVILQGRPEERPGDHVWGPNHPLGADVEWLASSPGVEVMHVQALRRYIPSDKPYREHYGFVEGASQPTPRIANFPEPPVADDAVALGELLLGYPNDRGELAPDLCGQLFKNGSFLVLRKYSQNVPGFSDFVKEVGAEAVMGRDTSGVSPLAPEGGNRFDYTEDPEGLRCPLSSHVRRANPRRGRRVPGTDRRLRVPRILRRGFSYGRRYDASQPDISGMEERGLLFMAYNASIAEQFEVVQRWMSGANSTGSYSKHPDLVAGVLPPAPGRHAVFAHDAGTKRVALPNQPFTILEWGVYLFVPSAAAIRLLSDLTPWADSALAEAGVKRITQLLALEVKDPELALAEWKRLLEDRSHRSEAREIWAAVRRFGGILRTTTYGVLVGTAHRVREVLEDSERFSVRQYFQRMKASFGPLYLGMDPEPRSASAKDAEDLQYERSVTAGSYAERAEAPNRYIASIPREAAFKQAFAFAHVALVGQSKRRVIDVVGMMSFVVSRLSALWFGMPDQDSMQSGAEATLDDPVARCPADFTRASQYIFHPNPSPTLESVAATRGEVICRAARAFVASSRGPLQEALPHDYPDPENALIGAINGFVAPTNGTLLSVMNQWIESGEIFRLHQWLTDLDENTEQKRRLLSGAPEVGDLVTSALVARLTLAMQRLPVPDLLHRKATVDTTLSADGRAFPIRAGERLVVSLRSASEDAPLQPDLLFGGDYAKGSTLPHACPGQELAMGVLLGVSVAVISQANLRRLAPLLLAFTYAAPPDAPVQ